MEITFGGDESSESDDEVGARLGLLSGAPNAMAAAVAAVAAAVANVSDEVPLRRSVSALSLGILGFLLVSSGPFGIEEAVAAAGAGPCLLAVFILPFVWGLPQAMVTAELSTVMDENGGYVVWCRRALGRFGGWMASYNSLASNICDLPIYTVVFSSYVTMYLERAYGLQVGVVEAWLLRLACALFVHVSNIRGLRSVSFVSYILSLLIVTPFVLEPALVSESLQPSTWVSVAKPVDWSLFASTMLWNWQGWDALGCIAGEVSNGRRSYPVGVLITVILITLSYSAAIMVGVSLIPDTSTWVNGTIEDAAFRISFVLGVWVVIGSMVANVGEMNCMMATSSRALWAMAKRRMVPHWLSYSSNAYGTPVAALWFQLLTSVVLMTFTFDVLVVLDIFFNNLSLILEGAAFVRLKYTEPNTVRPFNFPGGVWGAWIVTAPKFAICVASCAIAGWPAWGIVGGVNVLFVVAYFIRKAFFVTDPAAESMDEAPGVLKLADAVEVDIVEPMPGDSGSTVTASPEPPHGDESEERAALLAQRPRATSAVVSALDSREVDIDRDLGFSSPYHALDDDGASTPPSPPPIMAAAEK